MCGVGSTRHPWRCKAASTSCNGAQSRQRHPVAAGLSRHLSLPRWHEFLRWRHRDFPIEHPRPAVRPIPRVFHQALSYRIIEDIPGYRILIVAGPENVVVKTFLEGVVQSCFPQRRRARSFPGAHKLAQVGLRGHAHRFEMNVIGHEAIGIDIKVMFRARSAQCFQQRIHCPLMIENGTVICGV